MGVTDTGPNTGPNTGPSIGPDLIRDARVLA